MKRLLLYVLILVSVCAQAQIDLTTYYASADDLNKGELKTALYNIIKNPKVVGYDNLWTYFPITDRKADGTVWDMYSNNTYYFPEDETSSATGMDKEHAFPKSWWSSGVSNSKYGCYSDLFNLNPADRMANQSYKSNYTMAECDVLIDLDNGVIKKGRSTYCGTYPESDARTAWEPADEYKGDFARTYMYVVTCYEFISYASSSGGPTWSSDPGAVAQLTWNSKKTYPLFTDWTAQMLLRWHHNDPVSEKELNRNEKIYAIQGNRNPFIDYPDFADYIWGDKKEQKFQVEDIVGRPFFSSPKADVIYSFDGDSVNRMQKMEMQFVANNVKNSVNLSIIGTSKGTFKLPKTTLTATEIKNGITLTLQYKSAVPARDTVFLQISGKDFATPIKITLTAETFDTFQVLMPKVESNAFTMRWLPSADAQSYRVDVFLRNNIGQMDWQRLLFEDFVWQNVPTTWTKTTYGVSIDQQNYLRLGSGSNLGTLTTPKLPIDTTLLGDTLLVKTRVTQYNHNSKSGATLTIKFNDKEIVHTVTSAWQWFSDKIPTHDIDSGKCSFTGQKGKQVWLDSLLIESYESIESQMPVSNQFPDTTTATSYKVNNLTNGEHYWYTIQPLGGLNTAIYGPFEVVVTDQKTSALSQPQTSTMWSITDNAILLENLPTNAQITLYDVSGRMIFHQKNHDDYALRIPLSSNGIFILKITDCQPVKIIHSN